MKLEPSNLMSLEWKGTEYKIRKPYVKESMQFAKDFEKAKGDGYKVMVLTIDQLDKLGLPKAVTEEMEMTHITAVSNLLNGVDSTGK